MKPCKESEAAIIGQQKDIVVEAASSSKRYATWLMIGAKATMKMFSACCGPVWGAACITAVIEDKMSLDVTRVKRELHAPASGTHTKRARVLRDF